MKYLEYKVYTETENLDRLIEQLNVLNCTSIVINDPRDINLFSDESNDYSWNYVDNDVIKNLEEGAWVSFYTDPEDLLSEELFSFIKGFDFKKTIVDDEDWLHKWEEYFVPTLIGKRTVSKPVWREYEAKEGEIVIDIDPGLAFGTGYSATTYLAVRLIEKYLKQGDYVYDVGCGTGILSILCARLGASSIDAIDLDPKSVESTLNNIKINDCEEKVSVHLGNLLSDFSEKADFVAANLTAELVIELSLGISKCIKESGILVASGIIDLKEEKALDALKSAGFEILEVLEDGCWCAAAARKI